MSKRFFLLVTTILFPHFLVAQIGPAFATPDALKQALAYQPDRVKPLLLAHRGGPQSAETENSLETFRRTYEQLPEAIMEMDIRMTADSVLVLLHDDEIERTTTGKGALHTMTWESLQQLSLRNLRGKPTNQRIPSFDAVLKWGAGRVLMAIDAKPGVDLLKVMRTIQNAGALHSVFVICYSTEDAQRIRRYYPDCWIALGFNDTSQIEILKKSGLLVRNMIALASRQTSDFYQKLHQVGIPCTVGTYGETNLDAQPIANVADEYRRLVATGADIITTDRPLEVAALFK